MELSGWWMLAFIFWIFGYIKTKFNGVEGGETIQIARWAYIIICGFPASENLSKNTVLVVGLRFQIVGWLLVFAILLFTNYLLMDF